LVEIENSRATDANTDTKVNGLKPIISIHYNPLYIVLFLFLMATSGVVFPVEEPPAEVVPSEDPPLSRKDKKALLRDYG